MKILRAWAFLRREGVGRLARIAWNSLTGLVLARRTFYLIRRDLCDSVVDSPISDAQLLQAGSAEAAQLASLMYCSEQEIIRLLEAGSICTVARMDDRLAGYSWIHFGKHTITDVKYTIRMASDEAYIGPDYVHPDFRGQRLHSALLQANFHLLQELNIKAAWGSVNVSNSASIKGLAQVSFRAVQRVEYLRLLLFNRISVVPLPPDFDMRVEMGGKDEKQ